MIDKDNAKWTGVTTVDTCTGAAALMNDNMKLRAEVARLEDLFKQIAKERADAVASRDILAEMLERIQVEVTNCGAFRDASTLGRKRLDDGNESIFNAVKLACNDYTGDTFKSLAKWRPVQSASRMVVLLAIMEELIDRLGQYEESCGEFQRFLAFCRDEWRETEGGRTNIMEAAWLVLSRLEDLRDIDGQENAE